MHAWIEALIPLGEAQIPTWVAYDPTHNRRCHEQYIAVAAGCDYQDIAPTSGYYMGTAVNNLEVNISVVTETHGATNP